MASGDPCYPTSLRLRPAGRWARGPGPARRSRSRPSATRLPGVPGRPDLRQWRPCSYRDPARPGGGPLAGGSASFSEPCVPRQPPGATERPPAAHRRRLRLSTAASGKQASGSGLQGLGACGAGRRAVSPGVAGPPFLRRKDWQLCPSATGGARYSAPHGQTAPPVTPKMEATANFRVQEAYHSLFAMASRNDQSAPPRLLAPHGIGG